MLDLSSLNEAQAEAVRCTEGPLLVLAGAGSGKTRVLTYRIAHILGNLQVSPYNILAVTFTNKAATEMRERLGRLLPFGTRGMWVCTFHGMCVRILRNDAPLLGYSKSFTIYDADDSKRLVKTVMADLGINTRQVPENVVRSRISQAKNELISSGDYQPRLADPVDKAVKEAYAAYQERLMRADAMDFDDLLFNVFRLLSRFDEVREGYGQRFRYILVDEYQDTNKAQYEITKLLARSHGNLMVVGDDDQSIYSWRGADISNILDFEQDFPAAKVVKLEQNYRSTGHILNAANAVVHHNSQRKDKRLFTASGEGELIQAFQASDERDEGRWIGAEIEKLHLLGTGYDDVAVFYRTNAQSRILEDMMLRAGVPYRIVGGTRFFDRAEIRDVMAYLKMIVNPADEMSVKRVVNTPRRGIGSTSIAKIEQLAMLNRCSFFQACELAIAETGMFTAKVRSGLAEFTNIVREGRRMDGELKDVVEAIVEKTGLLQALRAEDTMESQSRVENIQEFLGVAAEFEESHDDMEGTLESLEELKAAGEDVPATPQDALFAALASTGNAPAQQPVDNTGAMRAEEIERTYGPLSCKALPALMEWLALRSDLDSLGEDNRAITMMTVHSAKGLEFPVVFVAGMEEGIFPHAAGFGGGDGAKIEEERRLAYVAITRARKRLFLTYAATRRTYGSVQANPRSRFVGEIPAEDIEISGVGSAGFAGTGWEKRGDRHGTFGSGRGADMYGGRVFGSHTRSTGGSGAGYYDDYVPGGARSTERRHGVSASAGRVRMTADEAMATFGGKGGSRAVQRSVDAAAKAETFAPGDKVSHKTFGVGEVISANGDMIEVHFTESGKTKKLMKGFAPIVKL